MSGQESGGIRAKTIFSPRLCVEKRNVQQRNLGSTFQLIWQRIVVSFLIFAILFAILQITCKAFVITGGDGTPPIPFQRTIRSALGSDPIEYGTHKGLTPFIRV